MSVHAHVPHQWHCWDIILTVLWHQERHDLPCIYLAHHDYPSIIPLFIIYGHDIITRSDLCIAEQRRRWHHHSCKGAAGRSSQCLAICWCLHQENQPVSHRPLFLFFISSSFTSFSSSTSSSSVSSQWGHALQQLSCVWYGLLMYSVRRTGHWAQSRRWSKTHIFNAPKPNVAVLSSILVR